MSAPTGRINLPIGMILRCLPPEVLASDLAEFEASGAAATEIGLPMNMILSQLPSGKVEMALQDLVPHFPAGYLQPTEAIASYLPTPINLPLMDVVMRIPPDLLALRPDQKEVDAAVINMADPFTEEILREQAEAARQALAQQAQPKIIEENQVPQAEEFIPQAAAQAPAAPLPTPVQHPPSAPAPVPAAPAATPAPPMPPAQSLPTPSAVRASSPTPPTPPSATARTISPSGRLPVPSRATTPIPTRPPASPLTPPTPASAQATVPIPPSQRQTAGAPPGAIAPQPPISTPSVPRPAPAAPSVPAPQPVAPPPPPQGLSQRAPSAPAPQPAPVAPPAPVEDEAPAVVPQPEPAAAAAPASSGDDLARLAALAMQQMGESDEQEPAAGQAAAVAKTIPLPQAPVEPEPAPVAYEEPAPVAAAPEPEPQPAPIVAPPAASFAPPPPVAKAPIIPAPTPPRTLAPERPKPAPLPPPQPPPQPVAAPAPAQAAPATASVAININTCTAEELLLIQGCSNELAASIVRQRAKIGSFKKLEDLLEVPGMTAQAFTSLTGEAPPTGELPYTLNELLGFPAAQNVTLKDVTERITCWPDVTGCVLSQSSGLSLVGTVPSGLDKTAIVAFVPRIFEAINKSFSEITGRETDDLILPTAGTSFTILRNKDLYLIILSRLPVMPERHLKVARFVLTALSARKP